MNHLGKIIKFDDIDNWYTIKYQDGDWEEMSPKEVKQYKCTINLAGLNSVRRLTRLSQAAALSAFKAINNDNIVITSDRIIPKGCVNVVFDDRRD